MTQWSELRRGTSTPFDRLPEQVKARHQVRRRHERMAEASFRRRRWVRMTILTVAGAAVSVACCRITGVSDPRFFVLFGLAGAAAAGFVGFKEYGPLGGVFFFGCMMGALLAKSALPWDLSIDFSEVISTPGMFRFVVLWLALLAFGGFLGYTNESRT